MIIRRAKLSDISQIKRIADSCTPNITSYPAVLYVLLINSTFVAENSNRVLGYLVAFPSFKGIFIQQLAVLPEHRKQGAATALLNKIFKLSSSVSLGVRKFNNYALNFYKKRGFKIVDDHFWFGKMFKLERRV